MGNDFHIAKAMGEEVPYSESYKRVLYIESVYRKHGITQADFDTSMVWYARHPDALTKVYEKVNQRLKAERDGINHLIALRDNKPKESSPGDSIDVWRGRHIYYLTGTPMDNKLTFTLPSDTNFKDRDTLRWTVRFRFLNGTPDSLHAPLMAMQVLYAKDTLNDMLKVRKHTKLCVYLCIVLNKIRNRYGCKTSNSLFSLSSYGCIGSCTTDLG